MWQHGSLRIGYVGGIALDIHLTFGLIVAWGGWQGWAATRTWQGVGFGILSILILFAAVLLHEIGHGLQARSYGLTVRRITLLPIGGLAELESTPASPWQELVIALAGPLLNLALAGVLGLVIVIGQPPTLIAWLDALLFRFPTGPRALLVYAFWANLVLFFFNMLPAFPMDGGRIIRAALALWFNYVTGTQIASWLGRISAVFMAAYAIYGWLVSSTGTDLLLLVAAVVVYFGARQEDIAVRQRRALVRVEAGKVCHQPQMHATPDQPLTRDLVARLLQTERSIPVIAENRCVGILSVDHLPELMLQIGQVSVAHVMRTDVSGVYPSHTLWVVQREMHAHQIDIMPIVENNTFLGIITHDDIQKAWKHLP